MRVSGVSLFDDSDCMLSGVNYLGCVELFCGYESNSVWHVPVSDSWPVLYDKHPFSLNEVRLVQGYFGRGPDYRRLRVQLSQVRLDEVDVLWVRGVDLVYDGGVCDTNVHFTGIVVELMTWTKGVEDSKVDVRFDEWDVVVATVPENDVSLLLRRVQDPVVVYSGKNHETIRNVRFVLLALFNRAFIPVQAFRF